jgi:hypothetical protein
MLARASWWQSAHERSAAPAGRFHNASPSDTDNMPALATGSRCIACVSRLMNSKPERRSARGISPASATAVAAANTDPARSDR